MLPPLYLILEVAPVAEFHHDEFQILVEKHIETFYHVGTIASLHQLVFSSAESEFHILQIFFRLKFNLIEVDHLDGNWGVGFDAQSFVDLSKSSSPNVMKNLIELAELVMGDVLVHVPVVVVGETKSVVASFFAHLSIFKYVINSQLLI